MRETLAPKAPASMIRVLQLPLVTVRAEAKGVCVWPEAITSIPVTCMARSMSSPAVPLAFVPECERATTI